MGIEDSNQGPGWHDHDTPYGPIHSYDGNTGSSSYGGGSGGNGGNRHEGITDKTTINIASTKDYNGTYMTMCVNNLKEHEGFKNSMYKDTAGNITVGIGHMLATAEMAAGLPFTRQKSLMVMVTIWSMKKPFLRQISPRHLMPLKRTQKLYREACISQMMRLSGSV